MPQMAPLNWISLFIYFSIIFVLSLIFTYFLNYKCPQKPLMDKASKMLAYWKW